MRLQRRCARTALSTARWPPSLLGIGKCSWVGSSRSSLATGVEVARPSKLLGAEAFGHLACELGDVTLLGCLDQDPLHAERLQLAAAARPRSGSRSTLDMSQRYEVWQGASIGPRRATAHLVTTAQGQIPVFMPVSELFERATQALLLPLNRANLECFRLAYGREPRF